MKKGDKLYVEGRIEYRQWQDKENQTRYSTEINVRELIMLGGGSGGGGRAAGGDFDAESNGGARTRAATPAKAKSGAGGDDFEDFPGALADEDDDLPFGHGSHVEKMAADPNRIRRHRVSGEWAGASRWRVSFPPPPASSLHATTHSIGRDAGDAGQRRGNHPARAAGSRARW